MINKKRKKYWQQPIVTSHYMYNTDNPFISYMEFKTDICFVKLHKNLFRNLDDDLDEIAKNGFSFVIALSCMVFVINWLWRLMRNNENKTRCQKQVTETQISNIPIGITVKWGEFDHFFQK